MYTTTIKYFLYFFCLNALITNKISAQKESEENYLDTKNTLRIEGIYGLTDFVKPHKDIVIRSNTMTIKFDTLNNFSTRLGNSIGGKIYLLDSNRVEFKNCRTTLAGCYAFTKSGFKYECDMYMDSLLICNKYKVFDSEIRFYRDSEFRLSIKPYCDILGFINRENLEKSYSKLIKVNNIDKIEDYVLVNSKEEMLDLGIDLNYKYLEFEYSSLVVIKNKNIQAYNEKIVIPKWIKIKQEFYPVSYAKAYIESEKGKMILDIINTYLNVKGADGNRRSRYSGIIIDKITAKKLKVNISYTE